MNDRELELEAKLRDVEQVTDELRMTRAKLAEVVQQHQELYGCLLRIIRQSMNGHGSGHDAIVLARKALKNANGGKMPDLACHCTPCAMARRDTDAR